MHQNDREHGGTLGSLADRVALLELLVFRLGDEVRTRRLVVEDPAGTPRIVAEVLEDGTAQVAVASGGNTVTVFAVPAGGATDRYGGVAAVGLRLSAPGEVLGEFDAWAEGDGRLRAHVHVGGG
jgi:hypothetical protein